MSDGEAQDAQDNLLEVGYTQRRPAMDKAS